MVNDTIYLLGSHRKARRFLDFIGERGFVTDKHEKGARRHIWYDIVDGGHQGFVDINRNRVHAYADLHLQDVVKEYQDMVAQGAALK